jgi:hypothetical protein
MNFKKNCLLFLAGNLFCFSVSFAQEIILPQRGCPEVFYSQILSICHADSIAVGSNVYYSTGTYTDTLIAINGCDSIITTDLMVSDPVDIGVTAMIPTCACNSELVADSLAASYQWVNCNTGYSFIMGATSQNFTIPAEGNYAVIITQNSCIDTSACTYMVYTGIAEISNSISGLSAYPNPAGNVLNLQFTISETKLLNFEISDLLGKTLYNSGKGIYSQGANSFTFDLNGMSNGFYFLKISDGKQEITKKFIVSK